jgi:hypothetical protein
MSRDTGTYLIIVTAISVLFAVLLFPNIHTRYGTWKSVLICLVGIAAIWVFGYLKARLLGWIGPAGRRKDED